MTPETARALIEGAFELEQWHVDGQAYAPPQVVGRTVYGFGTVTSSRRETMVAGRIVTVAQLGRYTLQGDDFIYGYDHGWTFTETASGVETIDRPQWVGQRAFKVRPDGDGVRVTSVEPDLAAFHFRPDGMTYFSNGALLREWRRATEG